MNKRVERLVEFLRFPSVSTDSRYKKGVDDCAEWVKAQFEGMGLKAQIHPTAKHSIVTAQNEHRSDRPTVLIYGHYDVQPVDPENLWTTPPFDPQIRDGKIWARGASDNKGQILAHMLGIEETLKEEGDLPVNVTFLVEGEEEIGSPNLDAFLENNKELLKADVALVSDTTQLAEDTPTLTYALRGIVCAELKLRGPKMDLHSGQYGGGVRNPATVAAQIAASLHDENRKVRIKGFYDNVEDVADWEKEQWSKIEGSSDKDMMALTGAPDLAGEKGYTYLERVWARPTAEVNGIGGGYQGEGSKTVLPSEALLKLSFRLVSGQKPKDIFEKLKKHVESLDLQGIDWELIPGHSGAPYLVNPHEGYGKIAVSSLKKVFNKDASLIREGGSIPVIESFKRILGQDTLLIGLALPDCRCHAPDENMSLRCFEKGIEINKEVLKQIRG